MCVPGAAVIQIDQGRIGGLTSTYRVRQLCKEHGRVFVNHSFKSMVSIAAALHVMATDADSEVMEFPQVLDSLFKAAVNVRLLGMAWTAGRDEALRRAGD